MAPKDRKFSDRLHQKYGNWALVAGAAEGIGEGFTSVLAQAGFNIIMVDHHAGSMNALAEKVTSQFKVEVKRVCLDLAEDQGAAECLEAAREVGARLLIYVAAYSRVKLFTDLSPGDLNGFLNINCKTLLHLVHGFSSFLKLSDKGGGIILVSSLAGLIGPRYVATYAATKAFSIRLAEALWSELKENNIDILACASGTVSTPTYWEGKPNLEKVKPPMTEPSEVAAYAISKLGNQALCIPGCKNRMSYFLLQRVFPRWLSVGFVNDAMKKMYFTG